MFYWYLHLWFDYVIKKQKTKKPRENQKKNKKNIPGLLQKQKSKKPRENQKKQKN